MTPTAHESAPRIELPAPLIPAADVAGCSRSGTTHGENDGRQDAPPGARSHAPRALDADRRQLGSFTERLRRLARHRDAVALVRQAVPMDRLEEVLASLLADGSVDEDQIRRAATHLDARERAERAAFRRGHEAALRWLAAAPAPHRRAVELLADDDAVDVSPEVEWPPRPGRALADLVQALDPEPSDAAVFWIRAVGEPRPAAATVRGWLAGVRRGLRERPADCHSACHPETEGDALA